MSKRAWPAPLLALFAAGCASTPPPATPESKTVWQVYLLAGQSNMDGYGYVRELDEPYRRPSDKVWIYTGQTTPDESPATGTGLWSPLEAGYGTGFATDGRVNRLSDRFGPELSFGQTLAALQPDARIALVKYSFGGTALAHGVGFGNWDPDSRDGHHANQYDHALATLREALAIDDIDRDGRRDVLVPAGIVWMQGESDANAGQAVADAYAYNLKRMMDLLRAALRVDDLPVVIGRITDSGMDDDGVMMDYIATVQEPQARFVADDACAAYVVATDDFDHLDDMWHYDTEGFIGLGTAFAAAMHGLRGDCSATRLDAAALAAPDALRAEVEAVERAFAKTMADRDHAAFSRFLSEEAVFLSGTTARHGKAAVADHWRRFFEAPDAPFSWAPETVSVQDSGRLAISTGPVFNAAGERTYTYTSIWRQEAPGVWRIVFDRGNKYCE